MTVDERKFSGNLMHQTVWCGPELLLAMPKVIQNDEVETQSNGSP